MDRRRFTLAAAGLLVAPALRAAPSAGLVVVELFTSQGCSSCPPADALLTELADGPTAVLPLAFHVTYWDRLGWRDPFSLEAATARQKRYAALWRSDEVYTPQLVVGGRTGVIGSDRAAVARALADATPATQAVHVQRTGDGVAVSVAVGQGRGEVVLLGFDRQHRTPVGRGENGGRTLIESNIVRQIDRIGTWMGSALELRHPAPTGEQVAVLLQAPDGGLIGAAREA